MPRGRLPILIVAATSNSGPSMTVTVPSFSFVTNNFVFRRGKSDWRRGESVEQEYGGSKKNRIFHSGKCQVFTREERDGKNRVAAMGWTPFGARALGKR